ncbi:hypothetical protein CYMTET_23419 [Cymbomonas tetramitiformis]|uniref:AT-hook motif nuclear-localized protein n=1 Tax=Cymbomonas tetramitiformis TaxID=36881 RepID=A0AAE0FZD5_9CHLO|nr:hypothetical protein CYMTET_23419 [Cymbomonas tetramitiformis]
MSLPPGNATTPVAAAPATNIIPTPTGITAAPITAVQVANLGLPSAGLQMPGVGIALPIPVPVSTVPLTLALPPSSVASTPAAVVEGTSGPVATAPLVNVQPSSTGETLLQKRKRGRPPGSSKKRLQAAAGLKEANGATAITADEGVVATVPGGLALSQQPDPNATKKPRGRPRGSTSKGKGLPLLPYILQVQPGQDLVAEISRVARQQDSGACMLAANGAVVGATLQHQFGGMVTVVKGPLEIVSLTGVVELEDARGTRTGFLNAALSATGAIVAGTVVGSLCAATPVQVVLGLMSNGNSSTSATPSVAEPSAGGAEEVKMEEAAAGPTVPVPVGVVTAAPAPAAVPVAAAVSVPAAAVPVPTVSVPAPAAAVPVPAAAVPVPAAAVPVPAAAVPVPVAAPVQ